MTKPIDIPAALGLPPLPSSSPDTIAALMWAREVLQDHQTRYYAIHDPRGIEELKSVEIGGVEQWLHIRGSNKDNPVLLFLHGGPGAAVIGTGDPIFRHWADYFTVVLWDQRQTGKSYYPADDENAPLSSEQFITDTEEVMQYLRTHLSKEKIIIVGASWGTYLGMHMVKRHPDWLHAYVGIGQVVGGGEKLIYERVIKHAKEKNEFELAERLEQLVPFLEPEHPKLAETFVENAMYVRTELARLAGETATRHIPHEDVLKMFVFEQLISPHLSLTDMSNSVLGDEPAVLRSPYEFTKEVVNKDLRKEVGVSFDIPIFFFTGFHDWQTPRVLSDEWFEEIEAPHKELLHFQESAHVVVIEEPGKCLVELVTKVLPFARQE